MAFFLQFHLFYCFNERLWKFYLLPFHVTLVIYSMLILFAIYIYQFDEIQILKENSCFQELSCEIFLSSFGIRRGDRHHRYRLDKELLTPTIFIVFIVIYIHFIHRKEKISDSIEFQGEFSKLRTVKFVEFIQNAIDQCRTAFWIIASLHIYKLVIVVVCFCLTRQTNVNLSNFFLVFIYVFSLFVPILQRVALSFYSILSSLHILMLMFVRLELFSHFGMFHSTCPTNLDDQTKFSFDSNRFNYSTISPLEWFGLWTSTSKLGPLLAPCE